MSFYRRLSIRKQIFVALVAIVVITTMAFGAVLYAASSRTISQEYEKAHANGIEVAGNLLDSNLRSIIDEERSYLTNTTFLENLARGTAGSRTFPASTNRAIVSQMQKTLFSGTAIRDAERFQPAVHSAVFSYGQYSGTGLGAGRGGRQRKGVSLDCLGI